MAQITNNYAEGSCVFESGSTQNGDVTVINQGEATPKGTGLGDNSGIKSPIHLSNDAKRIDLIRVMNAWYECGKVEDMNGNKLTKKDYFDWLGRLFNIDLSGYSNDLSNSMSSSVAYEKQSRIFDELKRKNEEIFNSK